MENVKTRCPALTVVVSIQLHLKAAQVLFMKKKYMLSKSWRKCLKEAKRRASEKQIRPGELFSSVIKNSRGQQNNQNIAKENESDRREQSENEVIETTRRKHPLTTKPIKNLVINSEPKNTSSTSKHKTIPTRPGNTKIPAATTLKSKVPRKISEIPAQVDENKLNKKRARPSDEKPNENGSDGDEPSSQDTRECSEVQKTGVRR